MTKAKLSPATIKFRERCGPILERIGQGMTLVGALESAREAGFDVPQRGHYERHYCTHPWFKEQVHKLRQDFAYSEVNDKGEVFPGFLEWRTRFCAYEDHRSAERPKRVVKATNSFYQQDSYKHLKESNRLLIVLPPGHIKTSMFAIEHSVWAIMRDRNVRIVIVQKNANEAEKIVMEVANRLSNHDYYHSLAGRLEAQGDEPIECPLCIYGDDYKPEVRKSGGGKWSAEGFKVQGVTSGEKDLTLEAKGVGGQIQGMRADIIVLDDVQDPQLAVKSPNDSADKMGWFQRIILGRVTEAQKVIVLANFFADNDFAHRVKELFEDSLGVPTVAYPAVLEQKGRRVPLCPEYWNMPALDAKKKEVGEETWFYTWMQEEGSFAETTFRREVLQASRDESWTIGEVPHAVTDIFIGCDPATAASGFCAIVTWGLDRRTKQRYLIDVFNKSGMRTHTNIIAKLVEYAERYPPRAVIVEGNAQQKGLINEEALVKGMASAGVKKLRIYQTMTGTGARDETTNFDITTIGGLFDAGLITLPYGGTYEDRARVDAYIDQFCTWRTDENGKSLKHLKRDMVMATLFAESEAFELARKEEPKKVPRRFAPSWGLGEGGTWAWKKPPTRPKLPATVAP